MLVAFALSGASVVWAQPKKPAPARAPVRKKPPAAASTSAASSASAGPTTSAAPDAEPAPSAKPVDSGGDVVERIDLGDARTSSSSAAPVASASASAVSASAIDEDKEGFQLRAWARTRGSAALRGDDAIANEKPGLRVPFDSAVGEQQLFLRLRYARGKSFEAVASGLLGYTLGAHTAYDPGAATLITSARGFYEASLREAYVGFFTAIADFRIGQQRIAWGNSDAFTPNEVINPRDLRDPILAETEVFRLPVLAARADIAMGFADLQLVAAPFFVPDRVDAYGTNWAFIQPSAPPPLRGLFARLAGAIDPSLQGDLQPLLRQTRLPAYDLSGASAGTKLSWTTGSLDVAHYYHYGYTYAPALTIDPTLLRGIATTDWTRATDTDIAAILAAISGGQFQSNYRRRHHVGTSAQVVARPFLFRVDGSYDTASVFTDRTLLGVVRPVAQGVLGVEYQTGEIGKTIIVEGYYARILGDPLATPLLGALTDTVSVASVLRWTFFEHVELELRGVAGIRPMGYTVRPQLAYKRDAWEVRAGVVWLDGEDGSLPRYYRRNSSVYAMVKHAF